MKRVEGEVFIGDWKSSGDVRAVSGRTLRESVYVPRNGGLKINT